MQNIILFAGNEMCQTMFADLSNRSDFISFADLIYTKSSILKCIYRIHTSVKINNIINLPFKNIWKIYFNPIRRYKFNPKEIYYIYIVSPIFEYYDLQDFIDLQKKYTVYFILIMIDTLSTASGSIVKDSIKYLNYIRIYTFDKKDAEKYSFTFTNSMYSKFNIEEKKEIKSDLYFIGRDKGRKEIIEKIYSRLVQNNIKCDFTINGLDVKATKPGIRHGRGITYKQIINEIQETDCIFEIIQKGQQGVTLRYYEAICYNKKLLTNNPDIFQYPYYNPAYIKYYSNESDIDIEWLKQKIIVNYHYKGDFSPVNLIL